MDRPGFQDETVRTVVQRRWSMAVCVGELHRMRNGSNEYISAYCTAAQIQQIGEKDTAGVYQLTVIYFCEWS